MSNAPILSTAMWGVIIMICSSLGNDSKLVCPAGSVDHIRHLFLAPHYAWAVAEGRFLPGVLTTPSQVRG